jgi:hypothetical protein
MSKIICPVCWHQDEIDDRWTGVGSEHDDPAHMVITADLRWRCAVCNTELGQQAAYVLLDAVLRLADYGDPVDNDTNECPDAQLALEPME